WLEHVNLCALERLVLRSPALQRFVLERHERAFRILLSELPAVSSVGIVGGGLFPRTALILRRLYPEARVVMIDQSEGNLAIAREFLSWERRPWERRPWERRHPCLLRVSVEADGERLGLRRSRGRRSQGSEVEHEEVGR